MQKENVNENRNIFMQKENVSVCEQKYIYAKGECKCGRIEIYL